MAKNKDYTEYPDTQNVEHNDTTFGDEGVDDSKEPENVNVTEQDGVPDDKASEVADKEKEIDMWKDKYLRLSAEFDNYRKRTLKEKMDIAAAGGEEVIKAILPVLDDLDRALENMSKTEDIEAIRSGTDLISQKLRDMLKSKGLKEIEAIGQKLDTDYHEAVAKFQSDAENKGKIIDVVQKGYMLKDKVIRHSKVVVGE